MRILALLLALALGLAPASARADGGTEIGDCLASGKVWLLVTTETGEALANQCVGIPGTGEEALAAGGMEIQFGKDRLVCTLSGHPAQCPRTFTGAYWAYYHGGPGAEYVYSDLGASQFQPKPGSIEAWCYTTAEKDCAPPHLRIVQGGAEVAAPSGAETVDLPVTTNLRVEVPSATSWGVIVTVAVIVVAFAGLVVWQRTRRRSGGEIGGR